MNEVEHHNIFGTHPQIAGLINKVEFHFHFGPG